MHIEKRDVVMAVVLSIVTCGIYGIFWYYKLAEEVNIVTQNENDTSAGMVLLLTFITCGIYGYVWAYQSGIKLEERKRQLGMTPSGGAGMYLLLYLLAGIGAYAMIQTDINNILDRTSGASTGNTY